MDPITDKAAALAALDDVDVEANAIEEENPEAAERVSRIKTQTQRLRLFIASL
jgi:hypothetical protein